jgi:MFS transporter, Spinster family, sphingosine-1-phosphate transporter
VRVDAAQQARSTRVLLWTLLVVYIFNFLDRQIVNILAEPIKDDLGLSDTQIGMMTGLAFALFYTVLGIPIARYADRPTSNRVGIISASLVIWSGMTALCGLAQNYAQLVAARIGVGVGEAGCTPAAMSLITDAVPAEQRSSAIAFYGLGIPIGSLLGMVVGGALYDAYGWRTAFMVVGLPGVAMAGVILLVLKDPRKLGLTKAVVTPAPAADALGFWDAMTEIGKSRSFVLLATGASITAFLAYGKTTWAAILFIRNYGLSPGEAGTVLGIVIGLAGVFGTWFGGWLADRWGKTDKRHILTGPAIAMTIAAPLLFLGYLQTNWVWAVAILTLPTILNSMYYGPTYGLVQGLVRPEARATATSIMLFCQNLIGLGLGPLLFGMMSDYFKPLAGPESVRWVLFGAAWLGLIPAFFFWLASRRLAADLKSA